MIRIPQNRRYHPQNVFEKVPQIDVFLKKLQTKMFKVKNLFCKYFNDNFKFRYQSQNETQSFTLQIFLNLFCISQNFKILSFYFL